MTPILPADDVEAVRRRFVGTQLAALAESHERLRLMVEELEAQLDRQRDVGREPSANGHGRGE